MMSNEHGVPEGASGAQVGGQSAGGVLPNGSRRFSALAGGSDDETQAGAGPGEPGLPGEPDSGDGAGGPAGAGGVAGRKRRVSGWREVPVLVVVALTIALVIKSFVVQPFFIPSSSMEDTLLIGDKVLVNKLVYHFRSVQPGDIIVFNGDGSWNPNPPPARPASNFVAGAYDDTLGWLFHQIGGLFGTPADQVDFIKRVIGTPGDRVACCNAQGLVTVNGVALHESSYVFPGAAPSQIRFSIVVPAGRLWVMGDNRAVSDDSRLRMSDPGGGTIPESQVIGRAFVVVWPPSHWKFLPIPSTFSQPGISRAGAAAAGRAGADAAGGVLGARVVPGPPFLPLAAGVTGAVPLTWLQLRVRRRLRNRPPRNHRPRGRRSER
jgi:signal peptidase I